MFAKRAQTIAPFYVMEVAKAAQEQAAKMASSSEPVIFLNIGEPDFTAPPAVQAAAIAAIEQGQTRYTDALGLPALRKAISNWYQQRFNLEIPAERIIITAGASAALLLTAQALLDRGQEVLMPDPSYPCNRHFVSAVDAQARLLPTDASQRYQLTSDLIEQHWSPSTRAVILASPSNPTGTSVERSELERIYASVSQRGGTLILDEIYLGLSYSEEIQSALSISPEIISINSFSKYFSMTGWRLGWMVVPSRMTEVIERLAQNFFICPSSVAQYAALGCFTPEALHEYERRRGEFQARRDYFIPALRSLGFGVELVPDGAFYVWADCRALCKKLGVASSWEFAYALLEQANIAITPGRDFGTAQTANYVRFSTASSLAELEEAVRRMQRLFL